MVHRAKSAAGVYQTLSRYTQRYPIHRFRATDNNLPLNYFRDLLPQLKAQTLGDDVTLFYSVKPNMTRSQIRALADAGIIYVQPGIESLSTHLLQLMRKGVSALQNVFFMKCSREYGIICNWNNLIRVPGETMQDYEQMAVWIPKLVHLRPPFWGARKIECHRFSPYFSEPGRWLENIRPCAWYVGLFPSKRINLSRVAYYFEADWKDTLAPESYVGVVKATEEWIRMWREAPQLPRLVMQPRFNGGLDIEDTRTSELRVWQLDATEARIYRAIDDPTTLHKIASLLQGTPAESLLEQALRGTLDAFVEAGLALEEGGVYLGLALPQETVDPAISVRRKELHPHRT